jgi:tetratricopeptide (TPR) repeat protein
MRGSNTLVRHLPAAILAAALGLFLPCMISQASAQASGLEDGPPPPPAALETAAPAADQPVWDPLHANKAIEVGTFYMKKGNYDAAIERFLDAARLQPGLAKPYQLLGEVYEKKGELNNSIAAYRKYLQIYRTAPDREKILKRIEKLESRSAHA